MFVRAFGERVSSAPFGMVLVVDEDGEAFRVRFGKIEFSVKTENFGIYRKFIYWL